MRKGDFIRIDYVGKVSESNEIFDLTKDNASSIVLFSPGTKPRQTRIIQTNYISMREFDKKFDLPSINSGDFNTRVYARIV